MGDHLYFIRFGFDIERKEENLPVSYNNNLGYAREHEPCIIFMDEIDAIGGRRFSEGTSADREIQRTLMEVCFTFN